MPINKHTNVWKILPTDYEKKLFRDLLKISGKFHFLSDINRRNINHSFMGKLYLMQMTHFSNLYTYRPTLNSALRYIYIYIYM